MVYSLWQEVRPTYIGVFVRFDLSFPVNRIPIDNQDFLIDSGVDEFTLLVMGGDHASLQLKNPLVLT